MPAFRSKKRGRYSSRPFVASTLLIAAIATSALLLQRTTANSGHQRHDGAPLTSRGLNRTTAVVDAECRLVHQAEDQCAFILANCEDDEAGLIHYLAFYYCTLGNAKTVAFVILTVWLGLLFTTIGIAASDFFSINLSTIASVLGLSESLAGVTFLAFGNGSPDVFSTFAAMGSNSGSMAVGELLGAAGFITAVVAGSMALVREFKVSKRTFVRDIVFFIAAISFTMVFLADGELHLWECCVMIGFYLFYVMVVVGWHWYTVRQRRRRQKDAAARADFYGATVRGVDELAPYRDAPDDDEAAPVGAGRSRSAPEAADISALERGPRIEVDGPAGRDQEPSDEDDEERDIHVAAEMTSSMRVNRPRWGRSNTTITPIRPSLVGVLEFRSVLSSLQKARNVHMGPVPGRGYTDHHGHHRWNSLEQSTFSFGDDSERGRPRTNTSPAHPEAGFTRERALSSGNVPLNLNLDGFPQPEEPGPTEDRRNTGPGTRGSSSARTADGKLAPPAVHPQLQMPSPSQFLQIRIPSPGGSGQSSPSLSPFPGLSESPTALTPAHQDQPRNFSFPVPSERRHSTVAIPGLEESVDEHKPVSWWPYQVLPPPHVLLQTIFPTLQGWRGKSWWDKCLSLISVPSIFLLVTTLPVVENDNSNDDNDEGGEGGDGIIVDPPELGQPGNVAVPVVQTTDDAAEIEHETEWQEYRRRTKSVSTSRSQLSASPSLLDLRDGGGSQASGGTPQLSRHPSISVHAPDEPTRKPTNDSSRSEVDHETTTTSNNNQETIGWNRWLVVLQLFTGPLFVVFVIWANMSEDLEQPGRALVRLVLYALLFSVCLLGVLLLTTTPDKRPKYYFLMCFLGFVISVAWISTIAGEVVGVLKAFGVILDISEAILGLTIFAVGNSLGDLVADVTVARLGYPVMALAACFGGPMLNILLGVGVGGAWMGISSAREKHRKHPNRPLRYKPYRIQVGGTLMVSAITVLLTLIILLIWVPSNKWIMSRKIGWGLIAIWCVGTVVNLVVELTGTWSDVS
ncbi:Sodium/calcium exchanger protein-domain-containing protein [Apodospora peruviana]|uniref:Sodium/calcium exchanger protein-domain-containing protein n=1 Tax=Apodospora peruviana TaxID=516989 RepID=A0AAE0IPJ6_9PEZI|nr:Sodium/calcium exchanger protein-domain-containing protein [Apodospora peruviana]